MAVVDAVRERIQHYRPTLEQILFGLSLLGVLVVVHLFIQQSRGFEQGCVGFSTLEAAESTFDCATVTSGPGSELFGVSNLTWGLGFYLAVAILTVLVFWMRPAVREWIQGVRGGVLTGGFGYSVYLVYLQASQIEAFCALCLASALVVTLLFGTQLAIFVSSSSTDTPMPSRLLKRQVAIFAYLAATALLVVGADVTYFDGLGGASDREARATTTSSSSAQCSLDSTKEPVGDDGGSLVTFQDITKGNAESDVTIIEYFDPNCPHCKTFHNQTMKDLVETYQDEVRFVFKPFPLRGSSLPEIQALYVAAQSGNFTQMLEAQYARQGQQGINMSDLRAIASEIDMDPDVVSSRVEQNEYRNFVLQLRKRAVSIGVDSTPTVLVNGHFVQDRSLECMETYIEQAKAGTLGGSASE